MSTRIPENMDVRTKKGIATELLKNNPKCLCQYLKDEPQLCEEFFTELHTASQHARGLKSVLGRLWDWGQEKATVSCKCVMANPQTSSPVVTDGKGADCGPSLGLAAGIPSLVATALLVALLFTLIHRRRSSDESIENPRRAPTHEKNIMGAEEAHIYVKTVAGSEEPMRDTYRPTIEMERRRGLWWLMPRLSLE
ncbi:hypothetical protein HPG69_019624 [Diceros bicornis minor]|uniref:Opalin n=1 Tax=Diceros bicornis minor TaxID=77932 RepID=A0A7J7E791_DICBM|nr:hypothetical protein HPG69_019624 [Diceros bicornis minor]